jgi:hypothetical protein
LCRCGRYCSSPTYAYPVTYINTDTTADSNTDTLTYANAYANADTHAYANADTHAYANADTHANSVTTPRRYGSQLSGWFLFR